MTFELAKQLKDARFRQGGFFAGSDGEWKTTSEGLAYYPSLSELIEACGDRFGFLLKDLEEKDWEMKSYTIEGAYNTFKECMKHENQVLIDELRYRPVVIIPAKPLTVFGEEWYGYTDLQHVFIRRDFFAKSSFRHEWIHIYLWLTNKRAFGDLSHSDELFSKCEHIK